MRSIYIGQLVRPAAAPLIMCMRVRLGGVAIIYYYPHPALLWVVKGIVPNVGVESSDFDVCKRKNPRPPLVGFWVYATNLE